MYSRTFAHTTNSQTILTKELSNYAMAAARRLREQGSICGAVTVFLATNRHRSDLAQYNIDDTIKLTTATDDTRLIIEAVHLLLKRIYKPHFQYKQAGVILSQLQGNSSVQLDLFASYSTDESARQKRLMRAIDTINERFGRNQIHFAVQGVENDTQDEPAGYRIIKKNLHECKKSSTFARIFEKNMQIRKYIVLLALVFVPMVGQAATEGLKFFYRLGERVDRFLLSCTDTNYITLPEHSWSMALTGTGDGISTYYSTTVFMAAIERCALAIAGTLFIPTITTCSSRWEASSSASNFSGKSVRTLKAAFMSPDDHPRRPLTSPTACYVSRIST